MKICYFFLPTIASAVLFFTGCKKDKTDKRLYARWKLVEYHLNGINTPDTLQKYYHGYEYEISKIDNPGSQSYCGCNAMVKIYDYGVAATPERANIGEDWITTSAIYSMRIYPDSCETDTTTLYCFPRLDLLSYSFLDDHTMQWKTRYSVPASHTFIFTKTD